MAKSKRIEMRASPEQRELLLRATTACGLSMSDFVLDAALTRAHEVLEQHDRLTLKNDEFDRLLAICSSGKSPNNALKLAAELARKSGD